MSNQPDNMDELTLSPAETNSALWQRIELHLEARLARFRAKNDAPLSHDETTALRGRIGEIKNLLAAGFDRD